MIFAKYFLIFLTIIYSHNARAQDYKDLVQKNIFDKEKHYLLYDPDLDEVLIANNHHKRIAPSSMTKLMTAYVVFSQLSNNFLELNDYCLIGKDAWNKYGSTMSLGYGDVVKISDLVKGLLVMSGNDASIALAQTTVSGGYDSFIRLMNIKAMELGMHNSSFMNSHGLNEDNHYSTLMDLAILVKSLYEDFPQYSHFLEIKKFEYSGIEQSNRNPLVKNDYDGILGGKTGYTSEGGYGVAAIVKRNHRRMIAVTNNMSNPVERELMISSLFDFGFNNFKKIKFFTKDETIANLDVWLGLDDKLEIYIKRDVVLNIPYNILPKDIEVKVKYLKPLIAPVIAEDKVADLHIVIKNYDSFHFPLYARKDIKKAGFFKKVKLILMQKKLEIKRLLTNL